MGTSVRGGNPGSVWQLTGRVKGRHAGTRSVSGTRNPSVVNVWQCKKGKSVVCVWQQNVW